MIRALLKKQLLELGAAFVRSSKTGKRRSRAGTFGYALLFVVLILLVMLSFGSMALPLAVTLVPQVPDTTVYANHSMLLDFVFRNSFRIYILYIYYSEETRKKQVPFLKQSSSTIPSEAQTATTAAQIAEHVRQTDFQA